MPRLASLIVAFLVIASGCNGGGKTTPPPPPNPPVIAALQTTDIGLPGTQVTFEASVTGEVTGWNWSFSEGLFPRTSTEQSPTVAIVRKGMFTAELTAENEGGTSAPLSLQRLVPAPVAPSWNEVPVPLSFTGSFPFPSFCVHQGRIIVQQNRPDIGAVIAVALTADPQAASDWQTYSLDMGEKIAGSVSSTGNHLVFLGSRPEESDPGHIMGIVGFATTALPLQATDWQMVEMLPDLELSDIVALESGWVGITFSNSREADRPVYFVTTSLQLPGGTLDWDSFPLSAADERPTGFPKIVRTSAGIVCAFISETGNLSPKIRVGASSVGMPAIPGDLQQYSLETQNEISTFDMEVFQGNPVIAYREDSVLGGLAQASSTLPVANADWEFREVVDFDDQVFANLFVDLAVAHDRLILSYGRENGSKQSSHLRQLDLGTFAGTATMDTWQRQEAIQLSDPVYVCQTLPYEDRLVTLYFDHVTESPALAFSDGPW